MCYSFCLFLVFMTQKQCFLLWGSPLSSASQWQYFASRQRCVCSACAYLCICRVKCILMFLFIGGLYQVSGPFLCPGDCNICDGHHHNHRAVVQICKFRMKGEERCFHFNNIWLILIFAVTDLLASHALCCLVSHCLHYGEYFFFFFMTWVWLHHAIHDVHFYRAFFLVPVLVLGIPHTASDRKQEVFHQPRGVCVRRSCHLYRHYPDLPCLAANYRLVQISPLKGAWRTVAYTCKY